MCTQGIRFLLMLIFSINLRGTKIGTVIKYRKQKKIFEKQKKNFWNRKMKSVSPAILKDSEKIVKCAKLVFYVLLPLSSSLWHFMTSCQAFGTLNLTHLDWGKRKKVTLFIASQTSSPFGLLSNQSLKSELKCILQVKTFCSPEMFLNKEGKIEGGLEEMSQDELQVQQKTEECFGLV